MIDKSTEIEFGNNQIIGHVENEAKPIGCIEYLGASGKTVEAIKYTDPERFVKEVEKDLYYGVPIVVVLYRDEQGKTIPWNFLYDLDSLPKDFRVEDAPGIGLEEEPTDVMKFYVSECGKYHNIGFYKENLSLEEAVKEYKAMIDNPHLRGESNELGVILKDDSSEEFVAIVSGNLMCMSKEEAADLNNHFLQQSITELKKDFTEAKTKETRKLEKNSEIKNPSGKRKNLHLDMDLG